MIFPSNFSFEKLEFIQLTLLYFHHTVQSDKFTHCIAIMMALDNIIVGCPCVILPDGHQLAQELLLSVAVQSAEYNHEQLLTMNASYHIYVQPLKQSG